MYGLFYEGERCPDGVDLFDVPDLRGAIKPKKAFRYRTDRREQFRWEIENLENPIVIEFINAREDADRIRFLSKFGLLRRSPFGDPLLGPNADPALASYREFIDSQKAFRNRVYAHCELGQAEGLTAINKWFEHGRPPTLEPRLDLATEKGTPRMLLRCKYLTEFMTMERVTAAVLGAKLATCEHCGAAFFTGPLTGRRSHAKYCSDRCRVAAMRARNQANAAKWGAINVDPQAHLEISWR
jgi:hypothetical protein